MQYCTRCRSAVEEGIQKCPNCRSTRLRPLLEDDRVLFARIDGYRAGLLSERLQAAGIDCETAPCGTGSFSELYDSTAMPTDRMVYVRYGDAETAKTLWAALSRELEAEAAPDPAPDPAHRGRRLILETVAVVLFLTVTMLLVFGADALANWLRGLFGL